MAVGLPLKTTYANGDVYSASDVNDTNGTVNLFTSSTLSVAAGKNGVINGGYDIWQRGTSISLAAGTSYTYMADRWQTLTGTGQACTISRQSVSDATNLPNIQYCLRYQRNSGQTGTGTLYNVQSFETANSIPFAGKAITFSFYARKGANYSAISSTLAVNLDSGTGTDQNRLTGSYTGNVALITSSATLTTTWQRFTFNATVPTNATELCTFFGFTPTGTAGTNDYYEITGVQLELGSTATTFSRAGGNIQQELATCQRYYNRYSISAAPAYFLNGVARGGTVASCYFPAPVEMRIVPSSIDVSGFRIYNFSSGTAYTGGTTTLEAYNNKIFQVNYTHGSSVFTTGTNILGGFDATSSYIGFSAEL